MKVFHLIILAALCISVIQSLQLQRKHHHSVRRYYDTWDDFIRWFIRNYGTPELGRCNDHRVHEGESESDWTKPPPFVGEYITCNKPTGKYILKT